MSAVSAAPAAASTAGLASPSTSPLAAPHLVPAADDAARAAAVAAALARANGKIRSTHLAELTSNGGVDVVPSSRIAAAAARAATRAPPPPAEEAADAEADVHVASGGAVGSQHGTALCCVFLKGSMALQHRDPLFIITLVELGSRTEGGSCRLAWLKAAGEVPR